MKFRSCCAVVTHNVVLRILLGRFLEIPLAQSYRLRIGHLEPFEFIALNGELIPAWSETQRKQLKDCIFCENA